MRILGLEPYYGGSHRAFLDGWVKESQHSWTLLTLPPFKWKWRMRHGGLTLARRVREALAEDISQGWDVVFCSSMLDLAQFRGLGPAAIRDLPALVYFHENQLTYPVRREEHRDLHFAFSNFTTALAATEVWFNSAFHREDFLAALEGLLKRMPDFQPLEALEEVRSRSRVEYPGIAALPPRSPRAPGPLRILWAARWEFDKNPQDFFAAIDLLERRGVSFRLSVLGESFREVPEVFARAREGLGHRIDRWGFLANREDYSRALLEADVFVSTADHEFFGLAAAEAIAAGCFPLLPKRLAYPELLAALKLEDRSRYLYGGSPVELATKLEELARRPVPGLPGDPPSNLFWSERAPELDADLEHLAKSQQR